MSNQLQSILRLPAVKQRVGLSRSNIYLKISQGSFPHPISLGSRAVGWLNTDIEAWIQIQIKESKSQYKK
ncbi:AlpA family phage regulatory protein [Candidatus Berkiella aquae]|uniref:AlpA family transcriptional regulator n=1 Tax=Candidatus Berkiella aquae TaxID=295108 RepID=A0A0Q9YM77_9GAMM|nr:AlpA family transcriptional regulator [Candidatus Berkiella aquae]MCS5710440.1 AlpA family transcriptional regulator [Candidatus Berkiella aquae]